MNNVQIPGKTDMSKVNLIIHILASLPEEYKVAVRALADRLMDTTEAAQLGIKTVCEKMTLRHNCV